MASFQAGEVVVKDEIRQSVRSIVMDLGVNSWEVITEQYDEEEYEQVIVVLREILEALETPRDIRPKCLKCLQAMAQRTVGSDDETSYQDNWRATREIVEQTLADIYSLIWDNSGRNRQTELILSSDRLPYAVDVLLEELDSLQTKTFSFDAGLDILETWQKEKHIFRFLQGIARQGDGRGFPSLIIGWALASPMPRKVLRELMSNDYMLEEELRCAASLLLMQINSWDTSNETRLKCIWCLDPIAIEISDLLPERGLSSDPTYILVEWALSTQRPWETIDALIGPESIDIIVIVDTLLTFMSRQDRNKIKCIQCLEGVFQIRLADRSYFDEDSEEFNKAEVLRSFIDKMILELRTFNTEDLAVFVGILQKELYKLDTPHTIRKSCVEGLQAIAQGTDLVPPFFALDDIEKRIINAVVTQTLTCPKPWELITKLDEDEYQFAVDILQENLDSVDTSLALRASSIKCLQTISRVSDVVPSSFMLEGIKKEGKHSLFRGGFADIWQGRLGSGTLVCLKVLRTFNPSYYDKREDDFKALHREALIWRQLKHPRIHPFLGIVRDIFPDQLCLVSPWSANGNLCDFLKANPEMDRLKLLIQVAEGIDYLHSHDPQIVHADIRGVNILVKDNYTCCLADFGLTMITETQAPTTTRMRSGATRWMPPEVLDEQDDIFTGGNHKSALATRDIYSFGCTIVEIYSGEAPYPSIKRDINVLKAVVMDKATPSRPSTIRLTDYVWHVTASCLSYDLTMRPAIQKVLSRLRACYEEPGGWVQVHYDIRPLPSIMRSPDPAYGYVATTHPLPSNSVGVRKVVISTKSSSGRDLQLEVGILHWHLSSAAGFTTMHCDKRWRFSRSILKIKAPDITWRDETESADFADFVNALKPGDRVVLFSREVHDIYDVSIDVFFQLG